ncbi:MAG: type II toxin-antitoxin system VapC family toxin [Deltaproteobacteria bacterium]|nr:type II toxin-antitoxin system VapC family toxin [Deltaproteobacteria bacterium]MCZ6625169.1 type II toxin-antitoxin system VapC family toxin [Deltaproteobacteria bacterium]
MSCLLDTNFIIGLLRSFDAYWAYLDGLLDQSLPAISTITRAEVYAGCHPQEEKETKTLLDYFITVPVESSTADMAGQYVCQFSRQGITLHLEDALIGATAVIEGLNLVTQNVSHFPMLSLDKNLLHFPTC